MAPDLTQDKDSPERKLLSAPGPLTLETSALCSREFAVFAVSTAFAAPLLHLVGAESGGFHFRGASSVGKTTLLNLAASVWGGGGVKGYIRQWRATENVLEALAATHCDASVPRRIVAGRAQGAGAAAYMLGNGAGKARAGRGGEGRAPAEWRTLFLSSGEIGIADKVAEDGRGRRATAGQQVRIIEIPAGAGAGMGAFEALHGFDNADAFARHLKRLVREHSGIAARAYLEEIAPQLEKIAAAVDGFRDEFLDEHCPATADGQVKRAAARFGLVAAAGELATEFGILPWPCGEAVAAAGACFKAWLNARGGHGAAEVSEGIRQVRRFIEQHGAGRSVPDVPPASASLERGLPHRLTGALRLLIAPLPGVPIALNWPPRCDRPVGLEARASDREHAL